METGLRANSAGIPYTLVLRTKAIGFPTFGLLLFGLGVLGFRLGFNLGFSLGVSGLGIRVWGLLV